MRAIDIVKAPPKTEEESLERYLNWRHAELISMSSSSKKIPISYGRTRYLTEAESAEKTKDWPKYDPDPNHCTGHGQTACLREGRHSWFNHSMDSYYTSNESNLPLGFKED